MNAYRYKHECGYTQTQFLKADKDSVALKCGRCKRTVIAHRVRDQSARVIEKDGVGHVVGLDGH